MIFGIVLLLLTGLCWVGIAVTVSWAAEKRLDVNFIQFASSAVIAAAAAAVLLGRSGTGSPAAWLAAAVVLAGAGNFTMIHLMRRAMVLGNKGAVWGITQSALICPFLMGMVCFGVKPTLPRLIGMGLILLGIVLFSRIRPARRRICSGLWLWLALGAFAASGAAQCLANLPSYWQEETISSELRACMVQLGTIGAFLIYQPFHGKNFRLRGTLSSIILLSSVQILSLFFFFYRGLNLVAAHGIGSIGYPVAQGSCIAFFLLYSRFVQKERGGWKSAAALISVLVGIAVIGL